MANILGVRASDSSHVYARVFTALYIYVANTNTSLGIVNHLLLSAGDVLTVGGQIVKN